MGIYITGTDMPKSCSECFADDNGWCNILGCSIGNSVALRMIERRRDCPLVEVPPHGRLGDLDNLERMFSDIDNAPYSGFDGAEPFYSADDAAQIIRLAHAIIPADPEESP